MTFRETRRPSRRLSIVGAIAVLLVAASCNKPDKTPSGAASSPSSAEPPPPPPPTESQRPVAWDTKRLVPIDATVDEVSFTISLPDGLPGDHKEAGIWTDAHGSDDHTLRVFAVVLDGPLVTSLAAATYQSTFHMSEAKFIRSEEQSNGYAITNTPNADVVEATTFKRTGKKWLKCKASRVGSSNATEARALVEAICDSVVIR